MLWNSVIWIYQNDNKQTCFFFGVIICVWHPGSVLILFIYISRSLIIYTIASCSTLQWYSLSQNFKWMICSMLKSFYFRSFWIPLTVSQLILSLSRSFSLSHYLCLTLFLLLWLPIRAPQCKIKFCGSVPRSGSHSLTLSRCTGR